MKKIKSMFEKNDLFKIVGIAVLFTIILTWIIPVGQLSGGVYTKYGLVRQGFSDIAYAILSGANFFAPQILFILFVGVFYGIISHISGYKALVNKIATLLKGKEKIFVVVSSLLVTLLTSFLTQTYLILIFVPFIIHIATQLKLDKLTAFLCTFGSMIIGILGATYGSDGFISFINYLNYYKTPIEVTEEVAIRAGILALAFILFNFFTILHMNKAKKKKEDAIEDVFALETEKSSKVKVWPMAVGLAVIALCTILGYMNWSGNFKIDIFTKFHTWLTELAIGDYTIISYILGNNALELGSWDLPIIAIIMSIVLILSAIIYRLSFDEMVDSLVEGLKKMVKPLLVVVLAFSVFGFINSCPFTVTICNWITHFATGFNPFLATLSAAVASFFHNSYFGLTSYALGDILTTTYQDMYGIGIVIYSSINGLVSLVAPTSIFLILGLSYLNIPYTKWIKHIWKFVLIMLVLLVLLFTLLTYL